MNSRDFDIAFQKQGYSAAVEITRPADFYLGEHAHPFDTWALVVKGEINIAPASKQNESAKTYGAGDMFQLLRGTLHCEYAGPDGVTYLSGRRAGKA